MKQLYGILIFIFSFYANYALNTNYNDSIKAIIKTQNDKDKYNSYLNLSEYFRGSNTDSAIVYVDYAISIASKLKDETLKSQSFNEKGVCYYMNNQYNSAILYYQKALDIDKKVNNTSDITVRLNNLGLAYSAIGNYSKAIDCFFEALKIDQTKNDKQKIAVRYNNLGIVYVKFKQYAKALEYFEKTLTIDSANSDKSLYSSRLSNIGMVYLKMNKPDQAITYFNKALKIDEKLNNSYNLAIRYNNLGKANLAKELFNEALFFFNKTLEFDQKSDNIADVASDFTNIGNVYSKINQKNKAVENYNKSLKFALQNNMPDIVIENYFQLSELYKENNDYKNTYNYFIKYQQLKDSVYSSEIQNKLVDLQNRSQIEINESEIALLSSDKQLKILEIKQKEAEIYRQHALKYWIIAISVFVVIILIFIYINSRNKSLRNKHILEQNLNSYMQKALSQQMNPHFIFNTLNSIQYFLLNNDKLSSNKYLTKFAKLMRITLDNSQSDIIPLNKEIESLNLYVELEQLRFDNKFLFEIINDAKPDDELISIPPLIIQPFVENAIWHGIMHREDASGGKLKIHFNIEGENLKCTVEDNGIGRKKANELKKQNKPEHVSLGTQITESRIDLINKLHKSKLKINYIDLCDENLQSKGTKVEIIFPL